MQLTHHSANDDVPGWTPAGEGVVLASSRDDEWAGKIFMVGVDGGMPKSVGIDYGVRVR